jgi:TnsA endonuclease N terminal/TnsA endonuclease C terminal
MAKRKRLIDETVIERRIKEGRGQGRGKDYMPWLTVQDVPSIGLATRIFGWTTGRVHHLFSLLELKDFLTKDWASHVVDIREQFPLLPIEETLAIARKCGIRYPTIPGTKQPIVLTTDFVVTIAHGLERIEQARAVKYSADLSSQRTLEKLELERRYWQARNIDWGIVTERDISHVLAKNVEILHNHRNIAHRLPLTQDEMRDAAVVLTREVTRGGDSLRRIAIACDKRLGLELGACLTLAYHLLATKQWEIDMHVPIQPGKPLAILRSTIEL